MPFARCRCCYGTKKTNKKEHVAYCHMMKRTRDKSNHLYGGRGISVCERWTLSLQSFMDDMGPAPSPKHSVDRYPDKNGNYEPGNCRWATPKQQARNRRSNRFIEYNGQTKSLAEWCEELGMTYDVVIQRILKLGWSVERAFTEPKKFQRSHHGGS